MTNSFDADDISGSSPRMRGTLSPSASKFRPNRFIPAYAGNTCVLAALDRRSAVHPRVCGEHVSHPFRHPPDRGSSPRMRGTLIHAVAHPLEQRFIPAYAGNTQAGGKADRIVAVHPRVCGEHASEDWQAFGPAGSSPRMRGTRNPKRIPARNIRFIPAYAGNTGATGGASAARLVHPRVCGEHGQTERERLLLAGSSPRMRGTQPTAR